LLEQIYTEISFAFRTRDNIYTRTCGAMTKDVKTVLTFVMAGEVGSASDEAAG
jgi:hypothetical protein